MMPGLPITIKFGALGDYKLWAQEGWHHDASDKDYTWADHISKLKIMLDNTKKDLLMQVDAIPLATPNVEQELFVFLNGSFVTHWTFRRPARQSALLEASLLKGRDSIFTFVMPKALSPKDNGIGPDHRTLGIAFRSLSLSLAEP